MEFDETKTDLDNLDKAFEIAASKGADINKRAKWSVISDEQYAFELFDTLKEHIPIMCKRWGKNGRYGQNLYGDVLDWMRDVYNELYRSSACDMFARLIIGEYVIKTSAL